MTTTFKNNIWVEDKSMGSISTLTEWKVWDCYEKQWSLAPPVVLRNVMLAANHPKRLFCIGQISPEETNPDHLKPFKPKDGERPFFLDLASNSRNDGRFTFAEDSTIGKLYYGESDEDQWKRIIYGSILHTGCKQLIYNTINYAIVDDERVNPDTGALEDDPTNHYHWDTGDSHGKVSRILAEMLRLPTTEEDKPSPNNPVQFRASLHQEWVAKGTVAWNPDLDNHDLDMVIPLSCLKGNKPALGNYTGKLLIGTVHEAQERRTKPGWQFFMWFKWETLEQDKIISRLEKRCQKLRDAWNDIRALANILRIDQEEAEQELSDNPDKLQSVAEYENLMVRIIRADKNGLLLLHPYVVRRVQERLASVWLNLAKAAGVRFYSLMAMPDEYFAEWWEQGARFFCAPDLPEGEYIVFTSPMRHWGDVQLWWNKHVGLFRHANATGVIVSCRDQLLDLGRDTDGDFLQLIRSQTYPALAEAIKTFDDPPQVEKLPKIPRTGSLAQVAVNSMRDITGIVASLAGKAKAIGAEEVVLEIPPGGKQTEPKEMRIIDFLSQELQIAVDSLKSAYPNNHNGLNAVRDFLNQQGADIPWLADFKHPDCYRTRPCKVVPDAQDTVSRIVKLVNSYWRSPDLKVDSSPKSYENVLFIQPHHHFDRFQEQYALTTRDEYRAAMQKAIQHKEANQGDTRQIRQVAERYKTLKISIYELTSPDTGQRYTADSWVAAFWAVSHRAKTGDAGLVFMMFGDEIVEELSRYEPPKKQVITIYAVQHGKWSTPETHPWRGQTVQVRGYMMEYKNKQYLALEMKWPNAKRQFGWHHLGLVGQQSQAALIPGMTKTMLIYATRFKKGKTTEVKLFDTDMTDQDIMPHLPLMIV
ncbi:hypothetical protein PN462_21145 [Spirulina sp. CS-785/01]|uniref:hypothetical protein n=1 Tax=Spirulina sp. CS-785/01 TaxID=3021716 RepID=UPI00232BD1EF|nr:hypothetical protein [Spirulina sp. CS-785/01]MDB9315633.1 hypothetical protein [Spirulina sp. CS-785/01]